MTIFLMLDTHRLEGGKNFEIFCYYFYVREDLKKIGINLSRVLRHARINFAL